MNPLPPLRTGRDVAQNTSGAPQPVLRTVSQQQQNQQQQQPPAQHQQQSTQIPPTSAPSAFARIPISLDVPGLPPQGKAALLELLGHGILTTSDISDFFQKLGNRIGQLTSRERTTEALTSLGQLTRYQATRIASGQIHGLVLGSYRILDRLSSGTVGVVFTGEHLYMRRKVAIKVRAINDTDPPVILERFEAEIRLLAGLNHPHIVTAYDAGVFPGGAGQPALLYLVMELVTGGDMENNKPNTPNTPIGVGCDWIRQSAAALAAAHAAGLVHRDVKPSNILLNELNRVKIIDFGLAREFASTATVPKSLIGTMGFLSPEQISDAPTAGPPADVYGLGAVLFWITTGQLPYADAKKASELIAAVMSGPPRRMREIVVDVPPELDELVFRMLAREPGKRPTPSEIVSALGEFATPSTHPSLKASGLASTSSEVERYRFVLRHLEEVAQANEAAADEARSAVLTTLAAAAATQARETPGHQLRVGAYSRLLATGLSSKSDWASFADAKVVDDLVRSASAHDVGLIGIPDEVAEQTEMLPSDRHAYESHTLIGDNLLSELGRAHGSALPFLRTARAVLRHHHERWDGKGYPDKLVGDKIPPAARIVVVADAYDCLRREDALSHEETVLQLQSQSGTTFDPEVVAEFLNRAGEFDQLFSTIPDHPDRPEESRRE